jgi:hypothetical protein
MNEGGVEPRTVMWAVAEVYWEDSGGTPNVVRATIEDTSASGACIRIHQPITVGSKLIVKWHREEFSAIARNCRSDGMEYLLGLRREATRSLAENIQRAKANAAEAIAPQGTVKPAAAREISHSNPDTNAVLESTQVLRETIRAEAGPMRKSSVVERWEDDRKPNRVRVTQVQARLAQVQEQDRSADQERKVMESKTVFPKFWRRQQVSADAAEKTVQTEVPVNKSQTRPAEGVTATKGQLLSYEDIYHAAGILRLRSGYDINKVVEMLHSERIRGLSEDAKRASVLMAIEAAGASVEALMGDATERQQALEAYEAGQRKQLEEFEARKAEENVQIQAELARVTAHYAERIKSNQDLVAAEKDALTNWQKMKQHESQRITEVMELCSKPAVEQQGAALAASVGASGASVKTSDPSLFPGGMKGQAN